MGQGEFSLVIIIYYIPGGAVCGGNGATCGGGQGAPRGWGWGVPGNGIP